MELNMKNTYLKSVASLVLALFTSSIMVQPLHAAMIGTSELLETESREVQLAQFDAFLAQEQVQAQFETWGVSPEMARERAASLTPAELQQLVTRMETDPAAGDGLGVVLTVFLILLILELVGAIDIFKQI
jgi:hypothetical protein